MPKGLKLKANRGIGTSTARPPIAPKLIREDETQDAVMPGEELSVMKVSIYPLSHSQPRELDDRRFPSQFSSWRNAPLILHDVGTHFGYVHSGIATIELQTGEFQLGGGMYFSVPGKTRIRCEQGVGFVATRLNYRGFFQLGGPAEEQGRLSYIDGCSDSLLLSPIVEGDPCLNLLYLPPNTEQTEHTHPSYRVGMIASGRGICRTPAMETPLKPGDVFEISPGALHSFHTGEESLRVIAWHPDSDFGPTHHNHPMINRTIIEREPVATHSSRTKRIDS